MPLIYGGARCIRGGEYIGQVGGLTSVEIWRTSPYASQRRRIDAAQCPVQSRATLGVYRPDIEADVAAAVGHLRSRMTAGATYIREVRLPISRRNRESAGRSPKRTCGHHIEGCHVGRQGIQIRASSKICSSKRWVGSAAGDEACPAAESPNLAFEILDFVEVSAPMQSALRHPSVPAEIDCIAQAFAKLREIPCARIMITAEMTTRACNVSIPCEARIF